MRGGQRLARVLLDEQDGGALRGYLAHDLEDLLHHQWRGAHRGFVEQQQPGPRHERAGHGEHLLLAAGERAGELPGAFPQAREDVEHALDVLRHAGFVAAQVGAHLQVFQDAHAREHAAPLRHHDQAAPGQRMRRQARDVLAGVAQRALGGELAGDGLHGGGLARAVGADQGDELALAHLERHALDGVDAAVGDAQVFDAEQRGAHWRASCAAPAPR
ncbi:MAG: hypothetical protein MO847_07255 [Candidatus Protistobacter heckmanni]|nr:hypothetical protein [Candidatus Protistobacter heckmanni]